MSSRSSILLPISALVLLMAGGCGQRAAAFAEPAEAEARPANTTAPQTAPQQRASAPASDAGGPIVDQADAPPTDARHAGPPATAGDAAAEIASAAGQPADSAGHGSLSGQGHRPAPWPSRASSRHSGDAQLIQRVLRAHWRSFRRCYELRLRRTEPIGAPLAVSFEITAAGEVVRAKAIHRAAADAELSQCVTKALRAMQFPAREGGGNIIIRYPLTQTKVAFDE